MGKIINRRSEWYLEQRNLYPKIMHGFRRGDSSIDFVIDFVTFIEEERAQHKITIAAFLDVKGAFDRVTHYAIFQALREVCVGGHLYVWIKSYLSKRAIFLTTRDGETIDHYVTRGVPQGGVLSITLFNIALIRVSQVLPYKVNAL